MKLRLVLLTFALGLRLFADALPEAEFTHALAFRGCMQEDLLALEVYLTQKPYSGEALLPMPYLRIEMAWRDLEHSIGKDLQLIQLSRHGLKPQQPLVRAAFHRERQPPIWLRGTLHLKKVEVNKQVEGSYEFAGPNDLRWTGTFKAPWGKNRPPCG